MKNVPQVIENIKVLGGMRANSIGAADTGTDARLNAQAIMADENAALRAWQGLR